ncbi:MAG: 50S ribosomal protein L35 [Gammaproteobacteria bacterium]|nr:50S ribosomal protein L35 [Gammaproteobacteria bacterium]
MPKMKSHGGSKKRFKKSGTGKIMRGQAYRDHLHSHKSSAVKRQLRGSKVVDKTDTHDLKKQIPYL